MCAVVMCAYTQADYYILQHMWIAESTIRIAAAIDNIALRSQSRQLLAMQLKIYYVTHFNFILWIQQLYNIHIMHLD